MRGSWVWAVAGAVGVAGVVGAHVPILTVEEWTVARGARCEVGLRFGHPFEVEFAEVARPVAVRVVLPGGESRSLEEGLGGDPTGWTVGFTPDERGDHWVVAELEGEHDGVVVHDTVGRVVNVSGVQVGWANPWGSRLQVEPLTRPYGLPEGVAFRGRVTFDGAAQVGVDVELEQRHTVRPDPLPPEPWITRVERTGVGGEFTATLPSVGDWALWATVADPDDPGRVYRTCLWVRVGP